MVLQLDKIFSIFSSLHNDKNKTTLWIFRDRTGRNTYEYSLNMVIKVNILYYLKTYNLVPNRFYGSIW